MRCRWSCVTSSRISLSDFWATRAALIAVISQLGHAEHRSPIFTGGGINPCLIRRYTVERLIPIASITFLSLKKVFIYSVLSAHTGVIVSTNTEIKKICIYIGKCLKRGKTLPHTVKACRFPDTVVYSCTSLHMVVLYIHLSLFMHYSFLNFPLNIQSQKKGVNVTNYFQYMSFYFERLLHPLFFNRHY